jgi:nucleoside phosphorylase
MSWEARPVLRALTGVRRERQGGFTSWCGSAGPYRVRVLRTGIGAERAAAAVASVRERGALRAPAWIVSTGCAGGLGAELAAGDLVAATAIVTDGGPIAVPLARDAAEVAAWAESRGLRLRLGSFYSSRRAVLSAAAKRAAHRRTDAIAVEMEGAAAAAAAAWCGGRLVAVRAILDPVDATLPGAPAVEGTGRLFPRSPTPGAPGGLWRIATLVTGQRAARRALEDFFAAFCDAGAGLVALERGTEDGATRPA